MATRIRWATDGSKYYRMNSAGVKTQNTTAPASLDSDMQHVNPTTSYNNGETEDHVIWLSQSVLITKIVIRWNSYTQVASGTGVRGLLISSDSTNGFDNNWTVVNSLNASTNFGLVTYTLGTPTAASWVRIALANTYDAGKLYDIQIYGDYVAPRFEFWNVGATAKLTGDIPLSFAAAPNNAAYLQRVQFQIKNTHSSAHTYTVTAAGVKYGGDPFVTTTNFKTSLNGGTTKSTTGSTTGSVAAGAFSGAIDIWGDFNTATNPADGVHTLVAEVIEAT